MTLSFSGAERRVGVEIELTGLEPHDVAQLVQARFGGDIQVRGPHVFDVVGTTHGTFECELDMRAAKTADNVAPGSLQEVSARIAGDVGQFLLPVEIVCPPIEASAVSQIDALAHDLRAAGAKGSGDNLLRACGLQLNPEIRSDNASDVARTLRAYVILSDWLRREIDVDLTRQTLGYAEPFPKGYTTLIAASGYHAEWPKLIDDYLQFNPTRNRELDMLPLFAWKDDGRVRAVVQSGLVKARPTYHYRLPNTAFEKPDWSPIDEWHRWLTVERLADDEQRLNSAAEAFLNHQDRWFGAAWADRVEEFIA